ncbi:MAG: glycosyltransferase family 2 protein [Armatimonadota bacterium]
MPPLQNITAIVIANGRPSELDGVLANLLNQDLTPTQLIVLDNDPRGSGKHVAHIDSEVVKYICPGEPLGTAAARNRAVAEATGDILLFIDEDTRFERYTPTTQLSHIFAEERVGATTFHVRNASSNQIVMNEYPGRRAENWGDARDVSLLIGCGFAVRRQTLLDLGGFDETFVTGGEEIDLSFRLINAGWRIHYVPSIALLHRKDQELCEQLGPPYWAVRNRLYLAAKHLPFPYNIAYACSWGWKALLAAVMGKVISEFTDALGSMKVDGLWQRAKEYRLEHKLTPEALKNIRNLEGKLLQ